MELQGFVERINREKDEIAIHNEAIKGIVAEAKEAGIVPKHLRQIVRESRIDPEVREDHLATLDRMRRELGWLADTPLGEAALRTEAEKAADWPRSFAEQRVLERRKTPVARKRGRPRKVLFDQEHPHGTA
jgi:uncharacterized protein (UPF0335 family)